VDVAIPDGPGQFRPCKPSGATPPPCIELLPPLRVRPEIVACLKDVVCRNSVGHGGSPPTGYRQITVGRQHVCALAADGRILCWGSDQFGQLGANTTETCRVPPPFAQTSVACSREPIEIACAAGESCRYVAVDAGRDHSCAIDTNGRAWCWGDNFNGQVNSSIRPPRLDVPTRVLVAPIVGQIVPHFVSVSAGEFHSCALTDKGTVFCWGDNAFEQSGQATGTPVQALPVAGSGPYVSVSAGRNHSCATTRTGEVECWGNSTEGEITAPSMSQSVVLPPASVRALHAGVVNGSMNAGQAGFLNTCVQSAAGGLADPETGAGLRGVERGPVVRNGSCAAARRHQRAGPPQRRQRRPVQRVRRRCQGRGVLPGQWGVRPAWGRHVDEPDGFRAGAGALSDDTTCRRGWSRTGGQGDAR